MEVWVATRKDTHSEPYVLGVFSSRQQAVNDIDPAGELKWSPDREGVAAKAHRLLYPVTIEYKVEPFLLNVS